MRRHIILDKPDGKQDQYEFIQNALNGGNVLVELQAGIYPVSKTLTVYSHTTIRATEHTVIRRMDDTAKNVHDCLITNADETGNGNECIEIDGGIWDMNNKANPRGTDPNDSMKSYGGLGMRFAHIYDLTLRDLTLENADSYFVRMHRITNFRILNVNLCNTCFQPNQDGIHLNGYCFHGIIRGLHAISPMTPNDDMIALNAYDGLDGILNANIELGPIEDIEIEDITGDSVYGFFRMLTKDYPIRDIRIHNCRGGVRYLFLNGNTYGEAKPGMGLIENVDFSDIKISKVPEWTDTTRYSFFPILGLQLKMRNVTFRNFVRPPIDNGSGSPTFALHPLCGKILSFEPDPINSEKLVKTEDGSVSLPDGGFRFLKIGDEDK